MFGSSLSQSETCRRPRSLSGLILLCLLGFGQYSLSNPSTKAQTLTSKQKTPKAPPKSQEFTWNLRLDGLNASSDERTAQLLRLGVNLTYERRLNEWLKLDLRPRLNFESGSSQSVYGQEKPETYVTVTHASADFRPIRYLVASAGALDQGELHSPIVAEFFAFPEFRIKGIFGNGESFALGPVASYAIPTSVQMSTETGEKEPPASLVTGGLFLNLKFGKTFRSKNRLNYFSYQNIPQSVENESVLRGNTPSPDRVSDLNYNLEYAYRGWEFYTTNTITFHPRFDGKIIGQYVKNTGAENGVNTGYSAGLGGEIRFTKDIALEALGHGFRIEPDASLARYASPTMFFTNRQGYTSQMNFIFRNGGFKIGALYTEAGLIYENEPQNKEKLILLRLETLDVSF